MASSSGGVKVLLTGDVDGKIEALFKRAASVNASNGPFHILLCVGAFLNPAGEFDIPLVPDLLSLYLC